MHNMMHCIIGWLAEEMAALKTQPNWLNRYKLYNKINCELAFSVHQLWIDGIAVTHDLCDLRSGPANEQRDDSVCVYLPLFFRQCRSVTLALALSVGASMSLRE